MYSRGSFSYPFLDVVQVCVVVGFLLMLLPAKSVV